MSRAINVFRRIMLTVSGGVIVAGLWLARTTGVSAMASDESISVVDAIVDDHIKAIDGDHIVMIIDSDGDIIFHGPQSFDIKISSGRVYFKIRNRWRLRGDVGAIHATGIVSYDSMPAHLIERCEADERDILEM